MDEINKIEVALNYRADEQLKEDIKSTPLRRLDPINTYIIIPDNFGSVDISGENKGKRTIRLDELTEIIEVSIFKKLQNEYRRKERVKFLKEIATVRDYIREE